ncbi:MAG: glycine cleavage system protein GcvH [Bacteroidales bacterium]|nr:glycine cleavage system protein GcvH [Bacteroidales bacterium]
MKIPENVRYTQEHEWVKKDGDICYVGITDFAQSQLGDIVFVECETVGETLQAGDPACTIEAVKTVSDVFMPVTGEVLEFNSALSSSPDLINKDPYGDGWIIKIKPHNIHDIDQLLNAEDYAKLIEH